LKALPPSTRRGVAGRAFYPRSGNGESFDVRFWPIGTPMFNFSIPAALKAYIDQIVRVGVTVSASNVGLLTGKKAAIILASGGDISPGSPVECYNQARSYLRQLLGWIGISDVEIVLACRARRRHRRDGRRAVRRGGQVSRSSLKTLCNVTSGEECRYASGIHRRWNFDHDVWPSSHQCWS
jgi:hypothetical protein